MKFVLPFVVLAVVVGFLFVGLGLKPREIPSPFIGRSAPAFELPLVHDQTQRFGPAHMRGKVWLFNVWASWCVSCRAEHPLLVELAKRDVVTIVGLNYKDEVADAQAWLKHFGNPYAFSVRDADGRVGIDYGVYGVPETFVVDGEGIIRYKHIGPLTADDIQEKILPLIERLQR